jgi:hypothetical protein
MILPTILHSLANKNASADSVPVNWSKKANSGVGTTKSGVGTTNSGVGMAVTVLLANGEKNMRNQQNA